MAIITEQGRQACHALAVPRAPWYRRRRPPQARRRPAVHPRALSPEERGIALACLHEERFQDSAPRQIYAALLDESRYHASVRTLYRLLEAQGENRERRDQLTHPPYQKPELLATGPNQLWSWDITKLRGPAKWTFYYLYVILDVFSRYVVGWMLAYRETATLAERLIEHACRTQQIPPGQLTIHADRGSSMKSKRRGSVAGAPAPRFDTVAAVLAPDFHHSECSQRAGDLITSAEAQMPAGQRIVGIEQRPFALQFVVEFRARSIIGHQWRQMVQNRGRHATPSHALVPWQQSDDQPFRCGKCLGGWSPLVPGSKPRRRSRIPPPANVPRIMVDNEAAAGGHPAVEACDSGFGAGRML